MPTPVLVLMFMVRAVMEVVMAGIKEGVWIDVALLHAPVISKTSTSIVKIITYIFRRAMIILFILYLYCILYLSLFK